MEEKILKIINNVRENNQLAPLLKLDESDDLRNDIGLNSFDLAELTVCIEDEFDIDIFENGLVNTVGEIYKKLAE
ncbi:phosphopantetheine-binding protein [Flavobacterium granuli]|uniref:Acyl carrier protein n=1 Tax=Flavobacterium granuli TaxID=280093 RepID=A0A1M5SKZ9_9FLAO|nr:phosphopantetheine-binding protein [Flavobacterium granuli]PRZ21008.1 acyl carrier protein [Flavobacterium granuli]SHH38583.1 acyl carrier protein [Flavobacterium granuli]